MRPEEAPPPFPPAAEEAPTAGAEVMMLPPAATCTLAKAEVVVKVEPAEFVAVIIAAPTRVEVVKVLP